MRNFAPENQFNQPKTLHLHIGIPKTATTWLQEKIYPRLDHLHYLDCSKSNMFKDKKDLSTDQRKLGHMFKRSTEIWTGFGDTIFENLIGDRQEWLLDNRDLLISDERIGRKGSRPSLLSAHFKELKIKAIDWGFEQLNIICMIRRQDHWLASHYAQMSNRNPEAGQADFEKLVHDITSPHMLRFSFGMLLDYNVLYKKIAEVTGENNLLMLAYEELKESSHLFLQTLLSKLNTPPETIEKICTETSGTKANVRSTQGVWHLRHKRPRIAGLLLPVWILTNKEKSITLTPEIIEKVYKVYSAGNQELARNTNLNLGHFGYFGHK